MVIFNLPITSYFFIIAIFSEETKIDSHDMATLEKRKHLLEKDNSILRAKLDIILEMLAEVTAEEELQQIFNK